jgi:carboxypeptidase Q
MNIRIVRLPLAALVLSLSFSCVRQGGSAGATGPYRETVDRLREAGLTGERAHRLLTRICSVGPRLTGSPQADAAVRVSLELMSEMGLDEVHSEPVEVGRWVRGEVAVAAVVASGDRPAIPLAACALGGSVATPAGGLAAPVVEVRSLAEAAALGRSAAGRIVFFNRPMDRRVTEPFAAYGGAADQRVAGASTAARNGAVAVLVRSLTFRDDRHPHTGMLRYEAGAPAIPAAAIATADADRLSALLREEKDVAVSLEMDCRDRGRVVSANAVGEITGSERPDEIVLLGGHLDSWDLGAGAHDDAAGCAAALEALALIRDLGLRPKRTIRAVFFMDEEFGGTGGRAYAASPLRKGERHIVAAESDRGAFVPIALAIGKPGSKALLRLRALHGLLEPFGIASVGPGGGGVDVAPLVEQGAVPAAVIPNSQPYFDVHHSALDTVASVHPRELELQAVVLAVLAYVLAQEGVSAP